MQTKISEIKNLIPVNIDAAREKALRLVAGAEKSGSDIEKAEVYHLIGLIQIYSGEAAEAIKWHNKEFKIREKLKDIKGASVVLNNLGAIYYQRGKLDKAREFYQKALFYREKINDRRGIAASYDNIGVVFYKYGMTTEALNMHFRALKINQETGDNERICISLQNIGLTYLSQGDYEYALENYKEALSIAKKNDDRIRAIQLMINIGTAFTKQKKPAEAKKYYKLCYEESQSINYSHGLILSLHNLADLELEKGRYRESIRKYMDCIEIATSTGHQSEIITAMIGVGLGYSMLKDFGQSLRYLHDALIMARKAAVKERICDIYVQLSEIYEKLSDYKKSLEYYKKYIALRNDLVNKDTTRTINEIKTRYEVDKKEKEAQLLKEKNETIHLYAHKLEVSNNELKQFAHVASHDLREPLRMVSSYMQLLARDLGDDISPIQQQFIGFAVDGARRMDILIHDLLRLAKVDANPKIEQVPLRTVIDDVKNNIEILLSEKNAQINIPELPALMADRTQLTQLFQNIIGNGIKYNESDSPTITISYQLLGPNALLSIADNGIGIPVEHRERAFQIFQRLPTARQYQGSGIGLAICKKIVDGMGGTIAIADRPGGGTIFNISLPQTLLC